jgi:transmembrane sensor
VSDAEHNLPRADNDAIEARASEWLARDVSEELTSQERNELDNWLNESAAHRVAYLRLGGAWRQTERLAALRHPKFDSAAPGARKRARAWFLQTAAAVGILAVLIGGGVTLSRQPHDRTFATRVGGHETVSFADGSKIELNTNTVLRARMTNDQRTVWLEKGEAFFRVKHDGAHPFVVMIGERRVTDVGTEFLVHRSTGDTEVAVVQGRVRFDAPDVQAPAKTAMLMPGDVATTTMDSLSITKKTSQELANELAWRRGLLIFKYTSLADAAAELNRYNRQQIVIADPNAARLRIIGTFPTNEVDAFIEVAQSVFRLHVEHRDGEVVLSR